MDTGSMERANYNNVMKFGKYFSMRMFQAIVQSRMGSKINTECKVGCNPDWFNVSVDELGEISAQIKTNIKNYPPTVPVTLEFTLFTADGGILPLEAWCISVDEEELTNEGNIRGDLYHQLSSLLKSAIASSRVTPMYRYYVKKQSEDTFVIFYRIYEGFPDTNFDMGDDQKSVKLGSFPTACGTFELTLYYRTKMEIEERNEMRRDQRYLPLEVTREDIQAAKLECIKEKLLIGGMVQSPGSQDEKGVSFYFDACSVGSPMSDALSHFSTSPSSQKDFYPCSIRSRSRNPSDESEIFKEVPFSRSYSNLSKVDNFPFSKLLTYSYSGPSLVKSQSELESLEEAVKDDEQSIDGTIISSNVTPIPTKESSLCSSTKDVSEDEFEDNTFESDGSFVKVAFNDVEEDEVELAYFISRLKSAPDSLFSFVNETFSSLNSDITQFESKQANFDRFLIQLKDSATVFQT